MESSGCIDQQAMIWNLWVGSQSHKRECLCAANPKEKEFIDSELAYGQVSKLLLKVATYLGLNLIAYGHVSKLLPLAFAVRVQCWNKEHLV